LSACLDVAAKFMDDVEMKTDELKSNIGETMSTIHLSIDITNEK
jgi:hypothetical protein